MIRLAKSLVPAPIRNVARRWRRRGSGVVFEQTHLGQRLKILDADQLSRGWYGKSWTHEKRAEFRRLADKRISEDALVFNIGAHQGIVAILLKRLLAPSGRVVAVEIDRRNSEACRRNFRENNEPDIHCEHAAISSAAGVVRYAGHSNSSIEPDNGPGWTMARANATSVDDLVERFGTPELIYMDVEGAEILALRGATKALGHVRLWFIELHGDEMCGRFGGDNAEVFRKLLDSGYRVFRAAKENGAFVEIQRGFASPDRCWILAERQPDGPRPG